jgi:hypothetical protein
MQGVAAQNTLLFQYSFNLYQQANMSASAFLGFQFAWNAAVEHRS